MKRMWSKNELRKIIQETYGIDIDNLVDKNGHERFIEGNIDILEEVPEITKTYGKWSLSGTHIMFVLAGAIANGTELNGKTISIIDIPDWIKAKIIPIHSVSVVLQQTLTMYGGTAQTIQAYLEKNAQGRVSIYFSGFTANADKTFRVAFDLLIDNE